MAKTVDEWRPEDRASAAHLNQMANAVNALSGGQGTTQDGRYGTTGASYDGPRQTDKAVFELTEDITYPSPTDQEFPAGWDVPPDVPYANACKQLWLKHSSNVYVTDSMPDEVVYFPTITSFDPSDDPILVAGDRVDATWDVQSSRWYADKPGEGGTATVIRCQVNTATVAITDDTFAVDGVTVISPAGASTPTVTTVNNVLHFPSVEDNQCIAFKDGATWYGIPEPPMETVSAVTEVDYTPGSPSTFQAKTTDSVVFAKAAESSFATWHVMIEEDVVISVDKSGNDLAYQTEKMWTPEALDSDASTVWESLTTFSPVTDIDYDTSDHEFKLKLTQDIEVFSQDGSGGAWSEDPNFDVQSPWHVTTEEDVVISVDKSTLDLRYQTEKTHALEAFDTSADNVWHTLVTVDPVTEVDYTTGTHTFDYKLTQNVEVFAKDAEDVSFTSWHSMVSIDPVTSIDYSTANNDFDLKLTQNVYVVEADSEDAAWTTWHATVAETVVTLVGVSGTTMTRTIENVRALEAFTANTSGSYHTGNTDCP